MRTILVLIAVIVIGFVIAPFLSLVWSNPKISDTSATTMTAVCLLITLSPTLAFPSVRRLFSTPNKG